MIKLLCKIIKLCKIAKLFYKMTELCNEINNKILVQNINNFI